MATSKIHAAVERLKKVAATPDVKISNFVKTRSNGQPEGAASIEINGKQRGEILAQYEDKMWSRRSDRTHQWTIDRYEVSLWDFEDDEKVFAVSDYPTPAAALAAAKKYVHTRVAQSVDSPTA